MYKYINDLLMSLTQSAYVNCLNYKNTDDSIIKVPIACLLILMSLTQSVYDNSLNNKITVESFIKVPIARILIFQSAHCTVSVSVL